MAENLTKDIYHIAREKGTEKPGAASLKIFLK
jgi:hypothetical protein